MAALHLREKLIVHCFALLLFLLLPLSALSAEESAVAPTPVVAESKETKGSVGIASYYAKRYNYRRTNSGQIYDPNKLTAAHQSLPHGTRVKVINLANDKEVVVTINDRCRARSKPFIDLSRAAAKQLGFLGKGIAKVRIVTLNEDDEET